MRNALIAMMLMTTPAVAHNQLADGRRVPKWTKDSCCGTADIHVLQPGQIHDTEEGYRIDGYPHIVPHNQALPSSDGVAYIFYRTYADGSFSSPYCFYIPMSF